MNHLFTLLILPLRLIINAQVSDENLILYIPFNGDVQDFSGYDKHGIAFDIVVDTNGYGDQNS